MNPEIRFRVPKHVLALAQDKAQELGLQSSRGRTGGASELARGALYAFLGLGLPDELQKRVPVQFERVRAQGVEEGRDNFFQVTVHHRVCDDYRKKSALKAGRKISSRQTTIFEFPQGELPHFLVPFITLSASGAPLAVLNLEGRLSPRPRVLHELVSQEEKATLKELQICLEDLQNRKSQREKEREDREETLKKGKTILRVWSQKHGSELLQARLKGGFEWLELAAHEYALSHLAELGLDSLVFMPLTHSLEAENPTYRNLRPQTEPQLSSIQQLEKLKEITDPGLSVQIVLVEDRHGRLLEGLHLTFQTPIGVRLNFLHHLIPAK